MSIRRLVSGQISGSLLFFSKVFIDKLLGTKVLNSLLEFLTIILMV